MSKFNNVKALETVARPPVDLPRPTPLPSPASKPRPVAPAQAPALSGAPTWVQRLCFVLLCAYLLSGYLNEFAWHFFTEKAYLTIFCLISLPLVWLFTGQSFRVLRTPLGLCWAGFGLWLVLATPFSVWRGGSLSLLTNYFPRDFSVCFFITACVVSVRQCRQLLQVLATGAFLVLILCLWYGSAETGRFAIPNSIFYSNANELALQLCLGIAYVTVLLSARPRWKAAGGAIVLGLTFYLLKTGSRGVFLALISLIVVLVLLSRHRLQVILVSVPVLLVALFLIPAEMRNRLFFIEIDPSSVVVHNTEEATSLSSQMQREHLLRQSVELTLAHPLFGVGPGEFMVAAAGEAEKFGKPAEWRGTHNSYTEVSSEAGLPAFGFYLTAILMALWLNLRRFRQASKLPAQQEIANLSRILFAACWIYAVGTFFFHVALTGYLPLLLGMTVALELAARPILASKPS